MHELLCGHLRVGGALPSSVGSRVFGQVHAAMDTESHTELWLTRVDPELLVTPYAMSDFMSGANGMKGIRHPDLVRIGVVDREETFAVVGYEALPGGIVLADAMTREGGMPVLRALDVGLRLLRGLGRLHRASAVHGVLSPRTVVVWEGQYLLWQYGLASHLPEPALASRVRRFGDDEMFAPELRDGQLIPPTDLFAWAVCLAQLLTGQGPSAAVGEVLDTGGVDALPAAARDLLALCLRTDPLDRPSDAAHFEARFEEATLTEASAMAMLPMDGTPPPPPSRVRQAPAEDDIDELELEPEPTAAASASERWAKRAGDSMPDGLADLAVGSIGEAAAQSLTHLTRSPEPAATVAESEPDFERLAAEAGGRDDPGLVELVDDGGPGLRPGARDAGVDDGPEPGGRDEALPPPQVARPLENAPGLSLARPRVSRGSGPFGPPARVMVGIFVVLSGGLLLLTGLHVVGERGVAAFLPAGAVGGTDGSDATGADGRGAADAGDASSTSDGVDVAADAGDDVAGAATGTTGESEATPPRDCPPATVALDDATCIDVAEYPGLRRIPRVSVTMRQAAAACEARGERLCSLDEWQRACRGRGETRYPYGNRADAEACNTGSVAGFPREVAVAGSRPRCVSGVGARDMVGNVGEWVAEGIAAGGDATTPYKGASCLATGRPPRGFAGENLGFRCCLDR